MYEVNQTIYHENFGQGTITKIETRANYAGKELPPILYINFANDNSTRKFTPESLTKHLQK